MSTFTLPSTTLRFQSLDVVFQEVPNEISLAFSIANCGRHCPNCHSPSLQYDIGEILTLDIFKSYVLRYAPYITCVCFLGAGKASYLDLMPFVSFVKSLNLKFCLYIGSSIDGYLPLLPHIDYLKIGEYVHELGGLSSPSTNQHFYRISNSHIEDITYIFQNKRKE